MRSVVLCSSRQKVLVSKLNMILLFWILILVFSACPAFAQDRMWSRTYGGERQDNFVSIQLTEDDGYIVVGHSYTFGAGSCDVYLIKTNSTGNILWSRTYGGSSSDRGLSAQPTTDGGYIVTGWTESFGAGKKDIYLIKTDSLGSVLWNRTYGGINNDWGISVQQTTDGGYIVGGITSSFGAGDWDVCLIKTDLLGNALWTRTYGGSGTELGRYVQQTIDGGYIVAGSTQSFGVGNDDFYLIKTDSLGNIIWDHTYGGNQSDNFVTAQQTKDEGYICAGYTHSFGAGGWDVCLMKVDSTGGILWSCACGGSSDESPVSAQQTIEGGCIAAGETQSFGPGDRDAYVVKADSLGCVLWTRTFGGTGTERSRSARQTPDGGYVVGGYTNSFGVGETDFILVKLDPFGNTCIGEFVPSIVTSISCSVTKPATEVSSPSLIVTSPITIMSSPATEVTTVCEAIRGDTNEDGVTNTVDIVSLFNFLFKGYYLPIPMETGDANCDGTVNVADLVLLVNYLCNAGDPPGCF
jgi:hypothetical protein